MVLMLAGVEASDITQGPRESHNSAIFEHLHHLTHTEAVLYALTKDDYVKEEEVQNMVITCLDCMCCPGRSGERDGHGSRSGAWQIV